MSTTVISGPKSPKFNAGEEVVLSGGPYKFTRGTFVHLNDDVKWAAIKEGSGKVSSHPVDWMSIYTPPAPD